MKAVTAASWPGETCVVALPSSATVKLTLRSTVKLLLAETLVCETPPTWKLTVTLLVIVVPATVPFAEADVAVPAATASTLAATPKRAMLFMVPGRFPESKRRHFHPRRRRSAGSGAYFTTPLNLNSPPPPAGIACASRQRTWVTSAWVAARLLPSALRTVSAASSPQVLPPSTE